MLAVDVKFVEQVTKLKYFGTEISSYCDIKNEVESQAIT